MRARRQNHEIRRVLGHGALSQQAGLVIRHGIAAALLEGRDNIVGVIEQAGGVFQILGCHSIGNVQFGGCTSAHADRGAVEVFQLGKAALLRNHDALPIIQVGRGEVQAQVSIPGEGPGGRANQDIDLFVLQQGEARLTSGINEFNRFWIIEDRDGNCPAHIDIEAGVVTSRINH